MNRARIGEIICVVLLAVFMVFVCNFDSDSDKTVAQVKKEVVSVMNVDGLLTDKGYAKVKKEFGIIKADYEAAYYRYSDSVMDVRELLIVKLKDSSQGDALVETIESRIKNKQILFSGYAPQESALLENYILKVQGNFLIYVVSEDAQEVYEQFKKAL